MYGVLAYLLVLHACIIKIPKLPMTHRLATEHDLTVCILVALSVYSLSD